MAPKADAVVLTQAELDAMRAKVMKAPETDADARRRRLKALSDERVRHWPNTLEAHRQNKENWKKQQEEKIEGERREVDRHEAMLQRQLRAETIKLANDKLYEQTGKMKLLRSNLLYAEVIETRKDQIAEKSERHVEEEALAAAYHKEMKRKVAEGDASERALAEARAVKERAIAEMQQEQLKEFQGRYIANLVKEKEDGDENQRKAKAAIKAEEEDILARKLKDRKEMEKMLAANQNLQQLRAERISEEQAYMETCRKQRDTLDRAARARKSLESKRFNERQLIRQQMIDKATRELEATRTAGDKKEEREAKEQLQKADDAAAKKQKEREDLMAEIERSRAIQIGQREKKKQQRREEDKRIKAYFKERTSQMDRLDKEEVAATLAREKQLRRSQQLQVRELKAKELAQQAYETVNHAHMLATQGEEDSRFKKIVHGYMDEFDARGQSTYLLHRTLNHKNPEMFPAGNLKL